MGKTLVGGQRRVEWLTLGLIVICYLLWFATVTFLPAVSLTLAILLAGLLAAFHSSLSHEAIHGHPTQNAKINAALVGLPLTFVVPYLRFFDTHRAHHMNERLTDPYDDPESNYDSIRVWARRFGPEQLLMRFNNTLAGRLLVGPWIGLWYFIKRDGTAMLKGDRRVMLGWALHLPGLALLAVFLALFSPMPWWALVLSTWFAMAILKIRTFLEHQAHEKAGGRTVIIEDRGPLALIFLNNNLHAVHHMHPSVPWYRLPTLYRGNRARYLRRAEGYVFTSYREIFRRYFAHSKDDVAHPYLRRD